MVAIERPASFQPSASGVAQKESTPTSALSTNTESAASKRTGFAEPSSNQERVSISSRAERMARIAGEYFAGTISSERIPELTQRLYEDGFIGEGDVQRLLGANASRSVVADAQHVVFRYLDDDPDTDEATTRSLLQVLSVIQSMDSEPTPQSILKERQSASFMQTFIDEQNWASNDDELKRGFATVDEVLQALLSIRSTPISAKSPIDLYTQVQDQLDSSANETDRER